MKLGYMTNAFGTLVGDGGGVTSATQVHYVTMCDDETMIKKVAQKGYGYIEIFDGNLVKYESDPGRMIDILKRNGVSLLGVYIGAHFIYPDMLPDELAKIEKTCELAQKLGAKHIVLGGGSIRARGIQENDYQLLADGVDKAAAIAGKYGLIASYHPHLGSLAMHPDQIHKLFSLTNIPFCPDIAHLAAGGGDALELIKQYYDRIQYVHLKDLDANNCFVPLGEGTIDLEAIIAYLKSRDYQGDWLVEIDGYDGDADYACEASYEYLKGKLI